MSQWYEVKDTTKPCPCMECKYKRAIKNQDICNQYNQLMVIASHSQLNEILSRFNPYV